MTAMTQTDAWAAVLDTHRGELVRAARARLGAGGADAEDVVHDVVVRVLRGSRDAAEMATPGAYLRRAVGNECVSRWRRTSREVLTADPPERSGPGVDELVMERIGLAEAMAALTVRQRRVVALTVLDDRPDGEAAAELGISEVTVRTTRSRALARMRDRLTAADQPPARVVRIATRARYGPELALADPRISA